MSWQSPSSDIPSQSTPALSSWSRQFPQTPSVMQEAMEEGQAPEVEGRRRGWGWWGEEGWEGGGRRWSFSWALKEEREPAPVRMFGSEVFIFLLEDYLDGCY